MFHEHLFLRHASRVPFQPRKTNAGSEIIKQTWPEFSSLGICVSVVNVTAQMTETCTTDSGCSSTLPNGAYYDSDGGYRLNMTSTANRTVAFADLKSPLVDFSL